LCVVMGKRGKYIPLDDALNYIAGYTIINDVSERRLKIRERAQTEEWDRFFDWLNGKLMDTFAPCGPWITTVDEIPDPQQLRIRLWVNGELQQDGNTRDMIFTVADIVHYLSHISTLEPGDLIATGTPLGVGVARGLHLKPGDVVTIEIDKIGRLENPVMSE
ncbi:MAG TPA: FAA hydrolase family protein, partial [Armatimonadetes bacterium]|nr:FAA hydrolase family protein [Armatimonadota bacterium]